MIPVHNSTSDYSKYAEAYRNHSLTVMQSNDLNRFKDFCCSLFHYSFNIIPNQQEGKTYTPANVAFEVPKFFAKSVNEMLTVLAKLGTCKEIDKADLEKLLDDELFLEVSRFLKWNDTIVYATLLYEYSILKGYVYINAPNYLLRKSLEELQTLYECRR